MHVRAALEEPDLRRVPALVPVVADVQGHMEVLDQVDEEPQGEPPFFDQLRRVLQGRLHLVDLLDDAALRRDVARELRAYFGSSSGTST
jgi:hypothetical protein